MVTGKGQGKIREMIMKFYSGYRTHILKMRRVSEKSGFHIHDYHGISYLYEYVPYKKLKQADKSTQDIAFSFVLMKKKVRKTVYGNLRKSLVAVA